jgi:hypothetical protein
VVVRRAVVALLVSISAGFWLFVPPGVSPIGASSSDPVDPEATEARLAALARARVFAIQNHKTSTTELPDRIDCRFLYTAVSGTTSKFDCVLADGERIRVKYGLTPEIHAEVAATRLLTALGFGADASWMVRRVQCYGCPRWPFYSRQIAERLHLDNFLRDRIDYDDSQDFEWVSVERRDRTRDLKFGNEEGWAFHELSKIDAGAGGATDAEVDALRLMAMFLNHWDNKSANQRLVCTSPMAPVSPRDADSKGFPQCDRPLAFMQDVGSTFGPRKVDLRQWSETPVWADPSSCTVSMKAFPYGGGTFPDARISEAGRRLLADRLRQLSASQIRSIFEYARFRDIDGWVTAFERRVAEIDHRPACRT